MSRWGCHAKVTLFFDLGSGCGVIEIPDKIDISVNREN